MKQSHVSLHYLFQLCHQHTPVFYPRTQPQDIIYMNNKQQWSDFWTLSYTNHDFFEDACDGIILFWTVLVKHNFFEKFPGFSDVTCCSLDSVDEMLRPKPFICCFNVAFLFKVHYLPGGRCLGGVVVNQIICHAPVQLTWLDGDTLCKIANNFFQRQIQFVATFDVKFLFSEISRW